jgi:hypothetical protein
MSDWFFSLSPVPAYRLVTFLKTGIAVAGALVLAWDLVANVAGRRDVHKRTRDSLLAALGCAAFLGWWNFGQFNFPSYIQVHEHYHYYLGAKYFPELRYARLYQCTAIADVEDDAHTSNRWIRNLATNVLEEDRVVVADPSACKRYFSAERWQAFKRDVAWFRAHRSPEQWNLALVDHGYNATPVWGIAGTLLTNTGPASDAQILTLALLDPVLLVVMWGFVWWAFGWRPMCVALIWWGTNYPARYFWTGGAFLRADWLALSAIGVSLVKRGRMTGGGFALTCATLLRIFPGLIIAGLALKAATHVWRTRQLTLTPEHKAFALGCVLALALFLPLSAVVVADRPSDGVEVWREFVTNSRKHLATPLTNNMGLKTVVSFDPAARSAVVGSLWLDTPWDTWTVAHQRIAESRRAVFWSLVIALVALFTLASRNQEDWAALVLGAGLIPIVTELTSYYYAVLLLLGLLWTRSKWTGVALSAISALSCVSAAIWDSPDDLYAVTSLTIVIFVTAIAAHMASLAPQLRPRA